jgi:hypothetical protein
MTSGILQRILPPMDMTELPRLTAGIYRAEDEAAAVRGSA